MKALLALAAGWIAFYLADQSALRWPPCRSVSQIRGFDRLGLCISIAARACVLAGHRGLLRTHPTRKKGRSLSTAFSVFFPCGLVAAGADTDAHSRSAEADAATILVTATLVITFAGGIIV